MNFDKFEVGIEPTFFCRDKKRKITCLAVYSQETAYIHTICFYKGIELGSFRQLIPKHKTRNHEGKHEQVMLLQDRSFGLELILYQIPLFSVFTFNLSFFRFVLCYHFPFFHFNFSFFLPLFPPLVINQNKHHNILCL